MSHLWPAVIFSRLEQVYLVTAERSAFTSSETPASLEKTGMKNKDREAADFFSSENLV